MASFSFEEAQDTGSFTFEEAAADSGTFSFEEGVDAGRTFGGTVKDVGVSAYKGMLGLQDSLVGLADIELVQCVALPGIEHFLLLGKVLHLPHVADLIADVELAHVLQELCVAG